MTTSRRTFLHGLSASTLVALAPRVSAGPKQLPSLRSLAGGHPLIGAAVPTNFEKRLNAQELGILSSQFDSVTPENCMKWQSLCLEQGKYRFDPVDKLVALAEANKQKIVGHTLIFNRDGNYPKWLFKDGGKQADSKLVWNNPLITP